MIKTTLKTYVWGNDTIMNATKPAMSSKVKVPRARDVVNVLLK